MDILTSLIAAARRIETPCAAGQMVWHAWNEGAGAPLVLLHGGNGSWRHWVRQIQPFAATRCVIAADLPGLGESDAESRRSASNDCDLVIQSKAVKNTHHPSPQSR